MSANISEARGEKLLEILFDVVTDQLGERAVILDLEAGEQRERYVASPALLTLAAKLLKDNNVTLQPEETEGKLSKLEENLAKRKKHSGIASVSYLTPLAANET